MKRAVAIGALCFTGLAHVVLAPPFTWVTLHPVAWVPALAVFARLRGRRAFLAGWLTGTIANVGIFFWIVHTVRAYTSLPLVVGLLALLLYALQAGLTVAVFAWGFQPVRRVARGAWPFAIAVWYVACEFANPTLFPYTQGVAWHRVPSVLLVAGVTGMAGLTFLVLLVNALVLQAWECRRDATERPPFVRGAVLAIVLIAATVAYGRARLAAIADAEATAPSLRVALVQPDLTEEERTELLHLGPSRLAANLFTLAAAAPSGIDAFVCPEVALPASPALPFNAAIRALARERGAEVWTGARSVDRGADGALLQYNSGYRIDRTGTVDPVRYDKLIRLPFGEYVPFFDYLQWIPALRGLGQVSAGTELRLFRGEKAKFCFLVCYEAIQSGFVRRALALGPDVLVNLTHDGWFGDTTEPAQHLALAAIQSAQFGVPLIRCTNTGISALVDLRGQETARLGWHARGILTGDVRLARLPTPYERWGDWFAWICVAGAVALVGRAWWTRSGAA